MDDNILFGRADFAGASALKSVLKEYEHCTRQCVNFNKSIVFFSSNTKQVDCDSVAHF